MAEWETIDLANPTEEHRMLREMVRDFVREEVEPQALEYDREEKFNLDLFRKLGEYGLLGISVPAEYGGSGMDATSVAIINEELSYSDPAFCLAYLAHSQLMVNNLAFNGTEEQKARILPKVCSGEWVGCMAMRSQDTVQMFWECRPLLNKTKTETGSLTGERCGLLMARLTRRDSCRYLLVVCPNWNGC